MGILVSVRQEGLRMPLRTAGLVGLAVLVAALGWWLLAAPEEDASLGEDLSAAMRRTDAENTGVEGTEPAADAAVDANLAIDTRSFRDREEREAAPDALTILFEDEAHVPQTEVRVELRVATQRVARYGGQMRAQEPPWRTLTSDARGEVVLRQLPPAGLKVVGRGQGRLGHASLAVDRVAPGERVVVTMKPIRKVEVRVVDQAGQPVAGAPVTASSSGRQGPGYHWTTRPDGIAAFEITSLHGNAYAAREFRALVRLPSGLVSSEKVPWVDGDLTTVDVEVKRGVIVRLKVKGIDGEPVGGRRSVRWQTERGAPQHQRSYGEHVVITSGLWSMPATGGVNSHNRRSFEGSETLLAGFKPGRKIKLTLEEEGRCAVEETVDLPDGESLTEVVMQQGAPAPTLEIPLVHEGGLPFAEGKFRLTVTNPKQGRPERGITRMQVFESSGEFLAMGGGLGGVVRTPNRNGIVRIDLQPGQTVDLKVEHERASGGMFYRGGNNKEQPLLKTQVAALEPGEVRRLDPLVIPPLPLIVAGRVVDLEGAGVSGALVRLAPAPGANHSDLRRSGTYQLMQLKVRTNDDGAFAIRGPGKIEGWRVYARLGDSGRSTMVPFAIGADDIRLQVVPTGAFEGVLLSAIPRLRPQIRLEPEGGSVQQNLRWAYPEMNFNTSADGSGRFRFEGLAPGRYAVHVRLANYEVLVVRGVLVESAKVNRDPRLDGVTVGGDLLDTVVTVRQPDGAPVNGARIRLRDLAGGGAQGPRLSSRTGKDGVARFTLPRGARRNVKVTVKDFLPYEENDCVFPLDVTLDPGSELVVQLDIVGGALPEDPTISAWQVRIAPKAEGAPSRELNVRRFVRSRSGMRTVNLDRDRRQAVFKAVPPGTWQVTIRPRVSRRVQRGSGVVVRIRATTTTGKTHTLGQAETEAGVWQKTVRFTVDAPVLSSLLPR
ncbi:MAG: hypothetical protein CMJ83_15340 [Planctomycetes bacterium]|nr:hypothetical protein [Planctomycetota bacterium]